MTARTESPTRTERFDPASYEARWRERWEADALYEAHDDDPRDEALRADHVPVPVRRPAHRPLVRLHAVRTPRARYKRMRGYNVLFPMGFDAFGLPAENAAINRGIHPHMDVRNIERMRGQLRTMGAMFDWSREVVTCRPGLLQVDPVALPEVLQARAWPIAAMAPVNWCPKDQTVLANEQVGVDRRCERCGTPVIKRDLEQWFFRITKYADELLDFAASTGRSRSR